MFAQPQTQWAPPQTQWSQPQTQWVQQPQQGLGQPSANQQASNGIAGGASWSQAQQLTQQWQQPQTQATASTKDLILEVSGCTHATVGPIVRGTYHLQGENHGKPTYKRQGQVNGLDVMMYYWDERDGPGFCGWWFGPKVGGDQVWSYHTDKNASIPPTSGWKVPYDGPVDASLAIAMKPKAAAGFAQPQSSWSQQSQTPQQMLQTQQGHQAPQLSSDAQQRLEKQKQQLEVLKQRQQLDNAMKAQEMRQKQLEYAQQAEVQRQSQLQKMEEQRKMWAEKQKQQMEAMKVQQQEIMRRRAEEQKKREEELAKKKEEQIALLAIRRVLQKYRAVLPEKHDEYRIELDTIVALQLEACGSQKERMKSEIEETIVATKERLEKVAELRKKQEEDREAEIVRRRELKKQALEKLAQLEELIVNATNASKALAAESEPFSDAREMTLKEVNSYVSAVEDAQKEANAAAQLASDFVLKEGNSIKTVPPVQGDPAPTCVPEFAKLVNSLAEVKRNNSNCITKVNLAKTTTIKKAEGKAKHEKIMLSFSKYDADKDGKLSEREIQAYAKGEHGLDLSKDALASICKFLIKENEKGVSKECFMRLKIMVGVQHELDIDAKKKVARERREAELAEAKEAAQDKLKTCGELVGTATESVVVAEKQVESMIEKAKNASAADMIVLADETDTVIEKGKKDYSPVKDAISALSGDSLPELKAFLNIEVKKLEHSLKLLDSRLAKCAKSTTKFRSDASSKSQEELENLRGDALAMLYHHQSQKHISRDSLFEVFTSKDSIGEADFLKFFKKCEKKADAPEMTREDLSRVFRYLCGEEEASISKDVFFNITRKFMKVAKVSVISGDRSIKSKPLRRLEEGEIVEVIVGPLQEGSVEVLRTHVKASKDGLEGWVTPVGNQGTIFLEDGGNLFKVVKETILTGSFVIGAEDSKIKERKLKVGEVCEVREWEKKEPTSGIMRMKVRCKADGQIGWATSVGNTGIKFLEAV